MYPSDFMDSMSGGRAPIATGIDVRDQGEFAGIPLLGESTPMGILAQLTVGPQVRQMFNKYGMVASGTGHYQNMLDVMRNRQFRQMQMQAMTAMSQVSTSDYTQVLQGIAGMTGTPWGGEQERTAREFSSAISFAEPFLAHMYPEVLEQLHGMRGSPAVMAKHVAEGGRYRIDPLSGRMGMSAETTMQMSQDLYRNLYQKDDLVRRTGVTAGQTGSLFDELTRRGMVSGGEMSGADRADAAGRMPREELERAAARQGVTLPSLGNGLSGEDLSKLQQDPGVASQMRSIDAAKVGRTLKQYAELVGVMKEIFGNDSPMSKLVSELDAMTSGNLGRMDPARLKTAVRTTQELSILSGVPMENAIAMQQHAASRLSQLGVDQQMAMGITQGSMAWGAAFRGSGAGAVQGWNRFDANAMQQMDLNLRSEAAASQQTARMATLMRVSETTLGFDKGSTAEAMAEAVRQKQTSFRDPLTGQTRSTMMNNTEFTEMLSQAKGPNGEDLGLTQSRVMQMVNEKGVWQQYAEKHGIANVTRQQQPEELSAYLSRQIGTSLSQSMQAGGVDREAAQKSAAAVQGRIEDHISHMAPQDFNNTTTRDREIGGLLKRELANTDAGLQVAGRSDAWFNLMANQAYGYTDTEIKKGSYSDFQNYGNVQTIMHKQLMQQEARMTAQAGYAVEQAEVMSILPRGSIIQKGIDYLQNNGAKANFEEFLLTSLGAQKATDVRGALESPIRRLNARMQELQRAEQQSLDMSLSPEQRAEAQQSRKDVLKLLGEETATTNAMLPQLGLSSSDTSINTEDLERTLKVGRDVDVALRESSDIRHWITPAVSDEELESVKKNLAMTPAEAQAMLRRERMQFAKNPTPSDISGAHDTGKYSSREAARASIIAGRMEEANRTSTADEIADMQGRANSGNLPPERYRELIIDRRRETPSIPSPEAIKAIRTANPKMSQADAEAKASAELQYRRQGISDAERDAALATIADPTKAGEAQVMDAVLAQRAAHQFDVSDADMAVARVGREGWDEAAVRTLALQQKQTAGNAAQDAFLLTASGVVAGKKIEDLLSRSADLPMLLNSKEGIRKIGLQKSGSLDHQLNESVMTLSNLAKKYSQGDVKKLSIGRLNIDVSKPGGIAHREEVLGQISKAFQQLRTTHQDIGRMMLSKDRDWGPPEDVARLLIMGEGDTPPDSTQKAAIAAMAKDVEVARDLSPSQEQNLRELISARKNLQEDTAIAGLRPEDVRRMVVEGKDPLSFADRLKTLGSDQEQSLVTDARVFQAGRDKMQKLATSGRLGNKGDQLTDDIQSALSRLAFASESKTRSPAEEAKLSAAGALAGIGADGGAAALKDVISIAPDKFAAAMAATSPRSTQLKHFSDVMRAGRTREAEYNEATLQLKDANISSEAKKRLETRQAELLSFRKESEGVLQTNADAYWGTLSASDKDKFRTALQDELKDTSRSPSSPKIDSAVLAYDAAVAKRDADNTPENQRAAMTALDNLNWLAMPRGENATELLLRRTTGMSQKDFTAYREAGQRFNAVAAKLNVPGDDLVKFYVGGKKTSDMPDVLKGLTQPMRDQLEKDFRTVQAVEQLTPSDKRDGGVSAIGIIDQLYRAGEQRQAKASQSWNDMGTKILNLLGVKPSEQASQLAKFQDVIRYPQARLQGVQLQEDLDRLSGMAKQGGERRGVYQVLEDYGKISKDAGETRETQVKEFLSHYKVNAKTFEKVERAAIGLIGSGLPELENTTGAKDQADMVERILNKQIFGQDQSKAADAQAASVPRNMHLTGELTIKELGPTKLVGEGQVTYGSHV